MKSKTQTALPTLAIEHVAIEKLIPYANNTRTHSDAQVAELAASIKEFGFTNPVLIGNDGDIIAGHGRTLAARVLEMKSVPCIRLGYLTDIQKRAYRIADNKLALNAGWDEDLLRLELEQLSLDGFEVGLTGFDNEEWSKLFNNASGDIIEDDVPDVSDASRCKPGEVWLLGRHRLMCGDSTKADDVAALMDGKQADMWLTDPPYNVGYVGKTKKKMKIENDLMSTADYRQFLVSAFTHAFNACKQGASFYVWHADSFGFDVRGAIVDCAEEIRQCLVWVKDNMVLGRQDYQWQHESCLYGWRGGGFA